MAYDDERAVRRPRGRASRLSAHRAVLALALVAAGPPLVLHDGWRGALVAAAALAYAGYLVAGKRRPRRAARTTGTRPDTAVSVNPAAGRPPGEEERPDRDRSS